MTPAGRNPNIRKLETPVPRFFARTKRLQVQVPPRNQERAILLGVARTIEYLGQEGGEARNAEIEAKPYDPYEQGGAAQPGAQEHVPG